MLILAFLICSDVLCSVIHCLVFCWKVCLFLPFSLQIFAAKKKVQILYLIILILVVIIKDLVSLTSDESLTMSQLVNPVINENLHERTLSETLVHVSVGFSREAAAVLVLRESPGL